MVSWCNDMTIGFTGLAFIDRAQKKRTSEWIAETLWQENDLEDGIQKLRLEAERAIARLPSWYPDKRLSIAIAGFPDTDRGVRGMILRISNFEHQDQIWPIHQTNFYENRYFASEPDGLMYLTSGARFHPWHWKIVKKRITRIATRDGDWNRVARLMVALQQKVSDVNGTVGRDSLVVSIPSKPAHRGGMWTGGGSNNLSLDVKNFSFYKDGCFSPERFGPHFVCGPYAFTDFKAERFGTDGQEVSVRLLKMGDGVRPPGMPANIEDEPVE